MTNSKMNSSSDVLCTICARGGSKGVKNKNLLEIAGKPLIAHSIAQAIESGLYAAVVVSTDSEEIGTTARSYGAEYFFQRPAELAQDTSAKLPVIRHALLESEKYFQRQFPVLVDLDATSPLRNVEDLRESLRTFQENDHDVLITGAPARRSPYFNLVERNDDGSVTLAKKLARPIVRRQDAPACFDMNASIYIWKRDVLIASDSLFLERTGLYVMPEERSIDIDSELDLEIVRLLMERKVRA